MKSFWIVLAVLVALFRVFLVFNEVNPHIQNSYEALAHGLVFGLLGWWLKSEKIDEGYIHDYHWVCLTCYTIAMILFSPVIFFIDDEFDYEENANPYNWQIVTVTALTWTEIICATVSILLR